MSAKPVLRRDVLTRRAAMSAEQREADGRAIAGALADLLGGARQVAAYVGVGPEPPTSALLSARPDVLLPVLLPDGDLDWAVAGELRPAARGLLEPGGPRLGVDAVAACDVVLVPALAVDAVGNRLGRGGGSYDRALQRATGLTIAVVYDDELLDAIPTEPHDVRVSAAVTPSGGLIRF